MAKSILTPAQRRFLTVLLALGAFMLGNAAYLWLRQPQAVLPVFYQWMLVLHVVVGILLLVPMAVFIAWHMRRALAMRNRRAIVSGLVVASAMLALAVTGLFIKEKANSAENAWAFVSHQLLALVVPVAYLLHRFHARHRPAPAALLRGVALPAAVLVAALAVHHVTLPEPPPPPQAFVARPAPGVDPYREHFPDHEIGRASCRERV